MKYIYGALVLIMYYGGVIEPEIFWESLIGCVLLGCWMDSEMKAFKYKQQLEKLGAL